MDVEFKPDHGYLLDESVLDYDPELVQKLLNAGCHIAVPETALNYLGDSIATVSNASALEAAQHSEDVQWRVRILRECEGPEATIRSLNEEYRNDAGYTLLSQDPVTRALYAGLIDTADYQIESEEEQESSDDGDDGFDVGQVVVDASDDQLIAMAQYGACKDESESLYENAVVVLTQKGNESCSPVLGFHQDGRIARIAQQSCCGVVPKNLEQKAAIHAMLNKDIPLVALVGKAGSGKTLLALACMLALRRDYTQLLVSRPCVPLSDEDMGYLPGGIAEKMHPYLQPLQDNLSIIKEISPEYVEIIAEAMVKEKIKIEPLSYIRGRSFYRKIMLVDEAQNLTPHEMKTLITRAGEGTKIILTGDVNQVDKPKMNSRNNGLMYVIERMMGSKLFAHVVLQDSVRSALAEEAANCL